MAIGLLAAALAGSARAGAKADDQAKAVVAHFIELLGAKDLDGILKVCDAPFFDDALDPADGKAEDGDNGILTTRADRAGLKKRWRKFLADLDEEKAKETMRDAKPAEVLSYKQFRKKWHAELQKGKVLDFLDAQKFGSKDRVVFVRKGEKPILILFVRAGRIVGLMG
jgi:hypothetical protein